MSGNKLLTLAAEEVLTHIANLEQFGKFAQPELAKRILLDFAFALRNNSSSKMIDSKNIPLNLLVSRYKDFSISYLEITESERDMVLDSIEDELLVGKLVEAGKHRHPQWQAGWEENLLQIQTNLDGDPAKAIAPKYFKKYPFERWLGKHVKVHTASYEQELLAMLVDSLVTYCALLFPASQVWEFGCGTGHHLLRLSKIIGDQVEYVGLDWADSSQEIIKELAKFETKSRLRGLNFDYFSPDYSITCDSESIFFTVASLEQVGQSHSGFIEFCLDKKPKVVINIEPIAELLGDAREQTLSKKYFEKRNYLKNYLVELRKREKRKEIQILSSMRTGLGSFFIEGYSVIIWTILQD
jgi:hypothetical protein